MDEHFRTAPFERNLPVLMGLLAVWYNDFFYFANGYGQSPVARAENPWRTEDARDCNIGADRLPDSPDDSFAPTVSDLADVSAQSPRPDRVGRLLEIAVFEGFLPSIKGRHLSVAGSP